MRCCYPWQKCSFVLIFTKTTLWIWHCLSCTEHDRLVQQLTSEKDKEWQSKIRQWSSEFARRIELLKQQHSYMINSLNEGIQLTLSSSSLSYHYHQTVMYKDDIYLANMFSYYDDETLAVLPYYARYLCNLWDIFHSQFCRMHNFMKFCGRINIWKEKKHSVRLLLSMSTAVYYDLVVFLFSFITIYKAAASVCVSVFRISQKHAQRFPWNFSWFIGVAGRRARIKTSGKFRPLMCKNWEKVQIGRFRESPHGLRALCRPSSRAKQHSAYV